MPEEKKFPQPLLLADGGAADVWVHYDPADDAMQIGYDVFTRKEARELRDWIDEWLSSK